MTKDLNTTLLLDVYGQLLTEKQRFAIDMYYNEDLSLAEIAREINISRQGVRESIKKGEKHLREYEEALGTVARFQSIRSKLTELDCLIDSTECGGKGEIKRLISQIAEEI